MTHLLAFHPSFKDHIGRHLDTVMGLGWSYRASRRKMGIYANSKGAPRVQRGQEFQQWQSHADLRLGVGSGLLAGLPKLWTKPCLLSGCCVWAWAPSIAPPAWYNMTPTALSWWYRPMASSLVTLPPALVSPSTSSVARSQLCLPAFAEASTVQSSCFGSGKRFCPLGTWKKLQGWSDQSNPWPRWWWSDIPGADRIHWNWMDDLLGKISYKWWFNRIYRCIMGYSNRPENQPFLIMEAPQLWQFSWINWWLMMVPYFETNPNAGVLVPRWF